MHLFQNFAIAIISKYKLTYRMNKTTKKYLIFHNDQILIYKFLYNCYVNCENLKYILYMFININNTY